MKKLMSYLSCLALCVFLFKAPSTAQAQVNEEGTHFVDLYYGAGSFGGVLFQAIANELTNQGIPVSSRALGPIGLRYEYMVSNVIGLGIDAHYITRSITWTETISGNTYEYEWGLNMIRAMLRMGIHFTNHHAADPYLAIGMGYRHASWYYKTNDPNWSGESITGVWPFACRFALGLRYFFTDNIGLHAEVGLSGGPLAHFGVAFRF